MEKYPGKKNIAVFISGRGSNLKSLIKTKFVGTSSYQSFTIEAVMKQLIDEKTDNYQ